MSTASARADGVRVVITGGTSGLGAAMAAARRRDAHRDDPRGPARADAIEAVAGLRHGRADPLAVLPGRGRSPRPADRCQRVRQLADRARRPWSHMTTAAPKSECDTAEYSLVLRLGCRPRRGNRSAD